MSEPVFTVIITTYNRKDILPRAISSVLNQTFRDFELLVIDNGSTDGTKYVVECIRDSRIKYISNPSPTNSCDAPRNLGIQMARGTFVSFLDDDDIWYPRKLEKVLSSFRKGKASVVCHYENINKNGNVTGILKHGPWTDDFFEKLLYKGNCLSPCAVSIEANMLRRFGGFVLKKEFDSAADYDLWLRMAKDGIKIYFIEEPLGECKITNDNWSIKDCFFQLKVACIVKEHICNYEKRPLFLISKRGLGGLFKLYIIAGRQLLKRYRVKESMKCFLLAMGFLIVRPLLIAEICKK